MTQRHEVSKWCWKNVAYSLFNTELPQTFQFVKNTVSAKCSELKHSKMRYACIFWLLYFWFNCFCPAVKMYYWFFEILWHNKWSVLVSVLCVFKKKVYFLLLGYRVLFWSIRPTYKYYWFDLLYSLTVDHTLFMIKVCWNLQ